MAPVSVQKAELRSTTTSRQGQCNDGAEELPSSDHSKSTTSKPASEPLESGSHEASITSRLTCASIMTAIFAVWAKLTFVTDGVPGGTSPLHSWKFPVMMNIAYLVSLPLLRLFTDRYLSKAVDVKSLLKEAMLIYNVGQVLVNFWMVCSFIVPVASGAHPFIGGGKDMVETGVTYAVWVHYCNKYLEYMDTYFMVLRGRMDQVSFLHVYHHTSISIAWWIGLRLYPGGDAYFGALLNSFIHVLMYSYYGMALMKIPCPWKRYLTQAQLIQFTSVVIFSFATVFISQEKMGSEHYIAHAVQVFEMTSLFVLFMAFYRKTYSKGKKSSNNQSQNVGATRKIESQSNDGTEDDSVGTAVSTSSDSSLEENDNRRKIR